MTGNHKPYIKPGHEFNKLIPKPAGRLTTVKREADLGDTIEGIQRVIRDHHHELARVDLRGKDIASTCRNIWKWCYEHFQYKLDEERTEQLKTPSYAWHIDRFNGIDCDDFSIQVGSFLLNYGLSGELRIIKQPEFYPDRFSHAYGHSNGFTIDPVLEGFNLEADYTQIITIPIKPMKLQILSGAPSRRPKCGSGRLSGLGRSKTDRGMAAAIARGEVPSNITEAEYLEWVKAKKSEGFSSYDEYLKDFYNRQNQMWEENRPKPEPANTSDPNVQKLIQALRGRGVGVSPKFTRDGLIKLLNDFPDQKGLNVVNGALKAFPLTAGTRNAVLLAIRKNFKNVASRIITSWYPNIREAKALGFEGNEDLLKNRKDAYNKLRGLFKGMGGNLENLLEAVQKGAGSNGLGEPVTAATLTGLAAGALAIITKILNQGDKNAGIHDPSNEYQAPEKVGAPTTTSDNSSLPIPSPTGDVVKTGEQPENPDPEKSWLQRNWILLALLGVVALGGGFAAYRYINRGDPEEEDPEEDEIKSLAGTRKQVRKPI